MRHSPESLLYSSLGKKSTNLETRASSDMDRHSFESFDIGFNKIV